MIILLFVLSPLYFISAISVFISSHTYRYIPQSHTIFLLMSHIPLTIIKEASVDFTPLDIDYKALMYSEVVDGQLARRTLVRNQLRSGVQNYRCRSSRSELCPVRATQIEGVPSVRGTHTSNLVVHRSVDSMSVGDRVAELSATPELSPRQIVRSV